MVAHLKPWGEVATDEPPDGDLSASTKLGRANQVVHLSYRLGTRRTARFKGYVYI